MRAPPGVDRLVRVPHHKEVFVIAAEDLHQRILELVNVLELVDHDILQPLLPLQPDVRVLLEEEEGEFDQIVVIQAEALLLLIQITVEDDVLRRRGAVIFLLQGLQGQGEHVPVVVRLPEQLSNLDPVPGGGKGHVPEGQAPFLVDDLEHGVNVRIVQHQEALGILDRVAVLLQDGHAEAVERVDIARVVVAGQGVDTLVHLVG